MNRREDPNEQQARLNREFWEREGPVALYAGTDLRPVEATLLDRYSDAIAGRVLELGCGAGRLTGHLCARADEVFGLDISAAMIAHCRSSYPSAQLRQGDLTDLAWAEDGSFEAVFAPFNVLDVLGDQPRRAVLDEVHRILVADGLLVFSSHNRAFRQGAATAAVTLLIGDRRRPLHGLSRLPTRLRNRRRLRSHESVSTDTALINDEAHEYSLLHYYIGRDSQERQLLDQGFTLIECLDLGGGVVPAGAAASTCPELHYVARRS